MNRLSEVILFITISGLVLFINIFPNYYAYLKTPSGMVFTGQDSWFDPWDINVYVAAIESGQYHGLLLENNYTTTINQPVFYYFVYTTAGSVISHINPFLLFHLLATLTGFVLLLVIWKTLTIFLKSKAEKLLVLGLITLGGGLGWALFPNFKSADLFMTGFTFVSQFQRPHEALGITLYLLSLLLFYQSAKTTSIKFTFFTSITLSLLAFFYPFYIISFAFICGTYSLILYIQQGTTKQFIYLLVNLLVAIPFYLFYSLYLSSSSTFGGVVSQQLSTPNIWELFAGYGILLPLSIFAIKTKAEHKVFLLIWFWESLLLSYLPFGFARFYLRTLFYPLSILAFWGVILLNQKYHFSKQILLSLLIALTCASTLYITYRRVEEANTTNGWIYHTKGEQESVLFIEKNAIENQTNVGVLAGYTLGNYIPAATEAKVFFGHFLQTPEASKKYQLLNRFYANMFNDDEARKFLELSKIDLILYGKEEQSITKAYNQKEQLNYKFLKPVFGSAGVVVYGY